MPITNPAYLEELKKLKQAYADLPWYQRFWFFIWSNSLHSALFAIKLDNLANKPTEEQIKTLHECATNSWFFNTIFGLLTRFTKAVANLPFVKGNTSADVPDPEEEPDVGSKKQLDSAQDAPHQKPLFQEKPDVSLLLYHVTHGNYAEVEQMLKKDKTLFTQRGKVTDCSKRSFSNITGFEYALWALDKHMWVRMLNCLPNDDEGIKIKTALQAQYKAIKEQAISYSLNGKVITEHHFDFKNTIIKELQTQVDLASEPNPNWDAVDKQWPEGVGGAQKLLPVHVVYEYCSETSFSPVPAFTVPPAAKRQFFNWITGRDENWFHSESKLGVELAIYKGGVFSGMAGGSAWVRVAPPVDLAAITALCEVRTKDFNDLEARLRTRPDETLDNAESQGYKF